MYQGEPQVGRVHAVEIIKHAFALCGRHAAVLFGTAIVVQAVVLVLSFVAMNTFGLAGIVVWLLLTLAAYQVSVGIYTLFLLHLRHGHEVPSTSYLLKEAATFALPLCWLGIVSSIGIGIGILFLLIPGIYLSLRWAVAAPALVAKRVGAMDALKISGALTKGNFGTIFVLGSIQGLITNLVPQLLTSATMPIENVLIGQALFAAVATPVAALASAELFMRLAGIPDRIAPDSPLLGGPVPTAGGPFVPGMPVALAASPQPYAAPASHQPYAAPATPQPYAAPVAHQPHAAPATPQPYTPQPAQPYAPAAAQPYAPPAQAYAPQPAQPYAPAPAQAYAPPPVPAPPAPEAPARSQSVGPPGMA